MPPLLPTPNENEQSTAEKQESQRDLAFRMLYEEQTRLRSAVQQIQASKASDTKVEDKPYEEQGAGDKDQKDTDGSDTKEGGNKPTKKAPLKQRANAWIHKHPILSVSIVVGAIILVIACILILHYVDSYEDTDDAFIDGHTDPISSRVNGIVAAVYIEDTSFVKKGQLLVELDKRDSQVAKEQAAANYAQAQASSRAQAPNVSITATDQSSRIVTGAFDVTSARANVAASDERYLSALADAHQAEANKETAERERVRYAKLVEKEEVSREQYDQRATDARVQTEIVAARLQSAAAAQKVVEQAKAQLGQAVQNNKVAKEDLPRQVAAQQEQLAQRKAAELAAKAQVDQAELNLDYTNIYAPEDGIIGDKQVQVATQIAPVT